MRRLGCSVKIFSIFLVFTSLHAGEHKAIIPAGMDLGLPFSPGIDAGGIVFVSGTIGNQPGTKVVQGGIGEQTRQVFRNIETVLKEAGLELTDIVSTNVYLADARHYQEMNEAYSQLFKIKPPVRTTVEAGMVIPGALVEISAVAVSPRLNRETVTPPGWPVPKRPYSWGIRIDDTLLISGMVGRDVPSGKLKTGSFREQAEQAFENVGEVLKAAGMNYSNVVSSRVYLSDPRDFQTINTVFRRFFKTLPPVRATVGARLADPEMKIEVQCIAVQNAAVSAVGEESAAPFSPALKIGDWLLMSGMVGRGPEGYDPGDVRRQTRQTLENLAKRLRAAGMGFEDVVDVQVFLADVRFYSAMNEVYREVMPQLAPARTTAGTPLMSPEALVEIMMTARKPAE